MPKIVVNACFGGFGLSDQAVLRYAEIKGINLVKLPSSFSTYRFDWWIDGVRDDEHYFYDGHLERDDPILVQVVEELGDNSWGDFAQLRIADVPDDVEWEIDEYDGIETVREKSRSW